MRVHTVLCMSGTLGTALGATISQRTSQPTAASTSSAHIALLTATDGDVTITVPQYLATLMTPHLNEGQDCSTLPSGSSKRGTSVSADVACAVRNGESVLKAATQGSAIWNELILPRTSCPNLVGEYLTARNQLIQFAQTLAQWQTQYATALELTFAATIVLAVAIQVWNNAGESITTTLIPFSWTNPTQPSAISSARPSSTGYPSETVSATSVPVCCATPGCNGNGKNCGTGPYQNCACSPLLTTYHADPFPGDWTGQQALLQSIATYAAPSPSGVPYYRPVNHPGSGSTQNNPL